MDMVIKYIKENKIELLSVIAIFILGVVLRLIVHGNFGAIWYDELFSWFFASRDSVFETVRQSVAQDIHMPLYFVILHFWIKIFGDETEVMRMLGFTLTLPLVPLGFYLTKHLFNKTTAYYTAIFFAINTFCIYYCLEIRMYCLNLLFSFLIAYSFAQMMEKFERKYVVLYIISLSLLFYNFTATSLIAFSYFIFGLGYLWFKKREYVKQFIIIHLIIAAICSVAIFWTIASAIAMHGTYTYFPVDNHVFKPAIFYDILENFFSHENLQILADDTHKYRNMLENLDNAHYVMFVVTPVVIGLIGLFRALWSRSEKLYMFLLPSLLFLALLSLLAATHQASMLTRYLTTIVLVVGCASCFGLAEFKNKIVSWTLFVLFLYFNLAGSALAGRSVYRLHRTESGSIGNVMAFNVKLRDDDYVINPLSGQKLFYHFRKGKYIPFSVEQAFALKDKESGRFYLGEMFDKLNRDTIKDYLLDDVMNDVPHKYFEDKLYNDYIKDMKKGQRIIFISFWSYYVVPLTQKGLTKENYKSYNMIDFLYSKAMRDCVLVLQKYLHYVTRFETDEGGYAVYVFEKE